MIRQKQFFFALGSENVAERSPYVQTVSWLYDLKTRDLLDLDPPYQRRSVWPDKYREDFIDTILLDYPAPPIFLFETISEDGRAQYDVVDGKQRLSAIFDFISGEFAVGQKSPNSLTVPVARRTLGTSPKRASTRNPDASPVTLAN